MLVFVGGIVVHVLCVVVCVLKNCVCVGVDLGLKLVALNVLVFWVGTHPNILKVGAVCFEFVFMVCVVGCGVGLSVG